MSMTPVIPVTVTRRAEDELEADLAKVRRLAQLLDAEFEIAGRKIGWDAIVGIVPIVGDIATAIVGAYPIHIARKHNLGRRVQARMALNLFIDWAVGEIPLLGDLFDVYFKANLKNADLLDRAARNRSKIG
jgi:hypothetical protein